MSTHLPPLPVAAPVTDENSGLMSSIWFDWFKQLNVRVGKNIALSNTELAALFPVVTANIAANAITAALLATITDGVTLDQAGTGSTLEIKSLGVGTAQIAAAAITAAKMAANAVNYATLLSTDWTNSQGANGYQKLPSGLYRQWGSTGSLASGSTTVVSFPISFPTACFQVFPGVISNSAVAITSTGQWGTGSYSVSGFSLFNRTSVSLAFNWFAIGN